MRKGIAIALVLALTGSACTTDPHFTRSQPRAAGSQPGSVAPQEHAMIAASQVRDDGVIRYSIKSPYQRGETSVRFLAPAAVSRGDQRFLFVLPVEPGEEHRYGDGLAEALRLRLHERHNLIVVAPSFSDWPWYGDHPSDPQIRQESYLLKTVIPLADRLYPAAHPRRLLLGFSKSGWGALALLLRHPDLFDAAAAWDAPLMMEQPGRYNSGVVFATQASFDEYRIPLLLQRNVNVFRQAPRIILPGYCNFRDDMRQAHDLMTHLGIRHEYADAPLPAHTWHSGWVEPAIDQLAALLPSQ